MIASGKKAWRRQERLRLWFEVLLYTTVEPPDHCAYLGKVVGSSSQQTQIS